MAEVASRFDRISDVYDETREPLSGEAIDRAAAILRADGCSSILELGVGTGRIARPLQEKGFCLLGADFSKGMLAKARVKGVRNLVMADGNHLPLVDKVVDAAVMGHVLHLLQDPAETFGKLSRVTRREVVAFVRQRDLQSSAHGDGQWPMREAFRRAADEIGLPLPSEVVDWRSRFKGETEFLASFPPSELVVLQDVTVVTNMGERLSHFAKRAYGLPSRVPEDTFNMIVERMKRMVDPAKEVKYRRVELMAIWRLPR